jgi:hypothetical protein
LILLCFLLPIGLYAQDEDAPAEDQPAAPEGIVFQNDSQEPWTLKFKSSGEMGGHKFEKLKPIQGSTLKFKFGGKSVGPSTPVILKKKTATKVEVAEDAKTKDQQKVTYFTLSDGKNTAFFAMTVSDGDAKLYLEKATFYDRLDVSDVFDVNKPGDGSLTIKKTQ